MYYLFRRTREAWLEKISSLELKASSIIQEANMHSLQIISEAQKKIEQKEEQKNKEREQHAKKLDMQLQKLFDKETIIDKKRDELDMREKKLAQDYEALMARSQDLDKQLERIA
jgi:hypothetical protein